MTDGMWGMILDRREPGTEAEQVKTLKRNHWYNQQMTALKELLEPEQFEKIRAHLDHVGLTRAGPEQQLDRWKQYALSWGYVTMADLNRAGIESVYSDPDEVEEMQLDAAEYRRHRQAFDSILSAVKEHTGGAPGWENEALRIYNRQRTSLDRMAKLRSWTRDLATAGLLPFEWAGGQPLADLISGIKMLGQKLANKMIGAAPSNK